MLGWLMLRSGNQGIQAVSQKQTFRQGKVRNYAANAHLGVDIEDALELAEHTEI
ncbi:hypothetical protein J2Z50_004946 [Ensifer mexicanus]|nr:hypothetical protein [Sinorhizobium mexicanum]